MFAGERHPATPAQVKLMRRHSLVLCVVVAVLVTAGLRAI